MPRRPLLSSLVLIAVVVIIGSLALVARLGPTATSTAAPAAQNSGVTVEYLGWSHYRLTSPSGKVVLTNPWVTNNPDAALTLDEAIARGADLILPADGHADDQGSTVELAKATGATVVTPDFAMGGWLAGMGVPRGQLTFTNPGDVYRSEGITVHVLGSIHGSTPPSPSEEVYYPGVAASFMITFENGFTVYFSGSSAATSDMALWGDWYKPDAAIIHISAAHEPRDAAMVAKFMSTNNPNLKTVFPHHHRLQPQPGGLFRPADLRNAIQELGVNVNFIEPNPLQPYTLIK
jgi:L-ascorbate metabolism protein UlaG (beta-lactamase superfamily)